MDSFDVHCFTMIRTHALKSTSHAPGMCYYEQEIKSKRKIIKQSALCSRNIEWPDFHILSKDVVLGLQKGWLANTNLKTRAKDHKYQRSYRSRSRRWTDAALKTSSTSS